MSFEKHNDVVVDGEECLVKRHWFFWGELMDAFGFNSLYDQGGRCIKGEAVLPDEIFGLRLTKVPPINAVGIWQLGPFEKRRRLEGLSDEEISSYIDCVKQYMGTREKRAKIRRFAERKRNGVDHYIFKGESLYKIAFERNGKTGVLKAVLQNHNDEATHFSSILKK